MPSKRRASRLSPEKRTADILAAARNVLAERGYHDTVVAEIAERAGVVEGSIYRYFRTKRDLMFRMAEDWFQEMIASDETVLHAIAGTWNRLHFIVHRHLASIHDHPDLCRLMFQHLRPDPDYRSTRLFALNQAYAGRVTEVIREGIRTGEVRTGVSPRLVRDMIFGTIEHRTWAFLRNEGEFDPDALASEVVDLVWTGLRANPPEQDLMPVLDRIETAMTRLASGK